MRPMKLAGRLGVIAAVLASVVAFALPASAHEPVILNSSDVLPWRGPLLLDGTDPWALYGSLPRADAVRSAQVRFKAGDALGVALIIPDLAPENTLATSQLPTVLLVAPNGQVTVLEATQRVPFTDPDSGRSFLILGSYHTTAVAGTYSVITIGKAPERFVLSFGVEKDDAVHAILRGRGATDAEMATWFATPPA